MAVATFAGVTGAAGCNRILGIQEKETSDAAPDPAGFRISLSVPTLNVVRGQSATVDVTLQRVGGFRGPVRIDVPVPPPNGVTADPLSLTESQTTAALTLRATSSADRGLAALAIYGLGDGVPAESQTLQLIVQDASGSQDLTFGGSGRVEVGFGTGAQGVGRAGLALAPQTRAIVLCGYAQTDHTQSSVALLRLTADGTPDVTFGGGGPGIVLGNSAGSSADACNAMFLRAGGGINLAGFASPTPAGARSVMVARYTPQGFSDQNTGIGGFVTTPVASGDAIPNGLLPSDNPPNDIDGYIAGGAGGGGAVFVRYHKYGSVDLGFGTNGVATIGPAPTAAVWLASQSSGNIVAAVASSTFRVVRLTPVGKLDTVFANGGVADVGDIGSSSAVVLVARQPKDALIAVGTAPGAGGSQDIAVVRLTESGQVDTTFGAAGWAFAHFGGVGSKSSVSSAVVQDHGAIVIAGQTPTDAGDAFSVVRFSADGNPDTTFGPAGRRTFDVGAAAQAIALDGLGRIVVAGATTAGVVVYRLWP